jgi:hypothetical protein
MNDREPPGYDDWFDDPEPPTLEAGRGHRAPYDDPAEPEEDVWVLPEDEPRLPRRSRSGGDFVIGGHSLTSTQVAILAIAGLALFIAILAAAGVFSSTPAPTTQSTSRSTLPTTQTTPTTPAVKMPTQTLRLNDTNHAQVKLLQKALTAAGYPVKADGQFGAGTQTALEDFQNHAGLPVDGVAGPHTLAALKRAVGG